MKVVTIAGPAGSGKSTALNAILLMLGHDRCLLVGGNSTAAGISQILQRNPSIRTVLIDDHDPKRIDLKAIKPHEDQPNLSFYVATSAGEA